MLCKLSTEQCLQQCHQQTRQIKTMNAVGCSLCIKYEIKERFWFQLGAFNQRNGAQYSFFIHIHIISYVLVVVK